MKKKVLIIEQNYSLGFVIKTVLNEAFKAIVTSNPFDAMDVLSQNDDISCIVLGIDKRSSQAHSFLQHLKSSSLFKNIPLIALTDIDEDTFREMYGESEISGVFKKPFDPIKVKQFTENLCHKVDITQVVFRKRGVLNLN